MAEPAFPRRVEFWRAGRRNIERQGYWVRAFAGITVSGWEHPSRVKGRRGQGAGPRHFAATPSPEDSLQELALSEQVRGCRLRRPLRNQGNQSIRG